MRRIIAPFGKPRQWPFSWAARDCDHPAFTII